MRGFTLIVKNPDLMRAVVNTSVSNNQDTIIK